MSGFTKLVPEIVQSSIWNESSDVRIVWITLLAVKNADGYVRGDVRTLSRLANVSIEAAQKAVEAFLSPDPYSHTPDNEGRRIGQAPGGWIVLNHAKYRGRDMQSEHAEYVRAWRAKKDAEGKSVNKCESHVTICDSQVKHPSVSVSVSASVSGEGGVGEGEQSPPDRVPDKVGDANPIASASLSTSTSTSIPMTRVPPAYVEHGELRKVRLTADEHAKLTHTHGPARLAQGIDVLDAYIAAHGKRYKSHYAVLKAGSWVWDRVAGQGHPPAAQNALRGGFKRVQEAPAEPNRRTPEEWDRIIAADEARKQGAKA